jgi:phage tail protein X
MQLRSQQGDTVDLILFLHYGYTAGITEQVLNLNPGLAALGPIIPTGTLITMPAAPPRPSSR